MFVALREGYGSRKTHCSADRRGPVEVQVDVDHAFNKRLEGRHRVTCKNAHCEACEQERHAGFDFLNDGYDCQND